MEMGCWMVYTNVGTHTSSRMRFTAHMLGEPTLQAHTYRCNKNADAHKRLLDM